MSSFEYLDGYRDGKIDLCDEIEKALLSDLERYKMPRSVK